MSREIKFRAWVKEHWIGERYAHMQYDWQDSIHIESVGFNPDDIPVMQYTGLKDKHGVEIYEGDIVDHKMPDEPYLKGETYRGSVEYVDELASFRTVNAGGLEEPIHGDIELEIIGNIYENPELLDGVS